MTMLGPQPVADPAVRLSAARSAVLAFLIEAGGDVTVQHVAASSGQHPNTVREHLEALVDAGIAERGNHPPVGRGRPALQYRAKPRAATLHGLRDYAGLVDAMATTLKSLTPDVSEACLTIGREWARSFPSAEDSDDMFIGMGFDAIREPEGTVLLQTCPILASARRNTEIICQMHLGMLRELLGDDVELEPFVEGGCRVRKTGPAPKGFPQAG